MCKKKKKIQASNFELIESERDANGDLITRRQKAVVPDKPITTKVTDK